MLSYRYDKGHQQAIKLRFHQCNQSQSPLKFVPQQNAQFELCHNRNKTAWISLII